MHLISELGHWVLAWGDSPWGALALFVLAFWESSFFPIPPDGLLIALAAGNLQFTLGFSAIATVGSLLGAMLGYWIGRRGGRPLLDRLFAQQRILYVERQYQRRDVWAVTIAAFTPIPYKVFAIGAGAFRLNFPTLHAGFAGRTRRAFLPGRSACHDLWHAGGRQSSTSTSTSLAIAFVVLLILGFIVLRFVMRPRAAAADASSD